MDLFNTRSYLAVKEESETVINNQSGTNTEGVGTIAIRRSIRQLW